MIHQFRIINPIINKNKPYLKNDYLIIPNCSIKYKYYIECDRYNPQSINNDYFLLLSINKFHPQCKRCIVDDYARLKIFVSGDVKKFVDSEIKDNGNVDVNYLYSEDNYDVFQIESLQSYI